GGWMWYLLVGKSILDMRDHIATATAELDKKNEEVLKEQSDIAKTLRIDPRLKEWRKISLPEVRKMTQEDVKAGENPDNLKKRHISQLQVEYEEYLTKLLSDSGFSPNPTVLARPADSKSSPPLSDKDKRPLFTVLAVNIKGQSSLDGLVKMLEAFHKAPILQQ